MSNFASIPVLVVDDYKTMVMVIVNLLREIGFKDIETAAHGEQAMEKIAEKKFELIISDWNMEPMNGLELLKRVRASDGYLRTIPFILVTAESKPENIVEAKKAGVNNYIVKPFTADTLRQKVNSVLSAI